MSTSVNHRCPFRTNQDVFILMDERKQLCFDDERTLGCSRELRFSFHVNFVVKSAKLLST